jgi:hypothetical protein
VVRQQSGLMSPYHQGQQALLLLGWVLPLPLLPL